MKKDILVFGKGNLLLVNGKLKEEVSSHHDSCAKKFPCNSLENTVISNGEVYFKTLFVLEINEEMTGCIRKPNCEELKLIDYDEETDNIFGYCEELKLDLKSLPSAPYLRLVYPIYKPMKPNEERNAETLTIGYDGERFVFHFSEDGCHDFAFFSFGKYFHFNQANPMPMI